MINFIHPLKVLVGITVASLISAAVAPLASAVTTTANSCEKQNETMICTWDNPGTYELQIPVGVETATVDMYGAQGGSFRQGPYDQVLGGSGGETTTQLTVKPETWLQINVGGAGKSVVGEPSGGSNGGGEASAIGGYAGGGGGGASDVRIADFSFSNRVIVAGGGGGAGTDGFGGAGNGGSGSGDYQGYGATETAGGGGGGSGLCGGWDGKFGKGGDATPCLNGAGGGGGGWFGGGGATNGSGGGGGSGHVDSKITSNSKFSPGKQAGNGKVIITYTLPKE